MSYHLHIISFNVPYPPDYGGVMDVFYKIKALHDYGVKIHLHCFEYGRKESEVLDQLCESVCYYKREHSLRDFTSPKPYIVKTRKSDQLLKNLELDVYPILFEGLHTCYYLDNESLKDRVKAVRMHNVEWDYYRHLGKNESGMFRRFYFFTESIKLKNFEKILLKADHLLPISRNDYDYLDQRYHNVTYLPAFHPNEEVISITGKGDYILYHGNLSVVENNQAAIFLVSKVFLNTDLKLIIAGSDPSNMLVDAVKKNRNIELRINPGEVEMMRLIRRAHINLLPTFQNTGTKLKLLNALFNGRFVVANSPMVENTGLEQLCTIRDTADDMRKTVMELMNESFGENEIENRKLVLGKLYSNKENAAKLLPLLFAVSQ
ncbi:MAG: glycosyltransferase [Chitinophagales bacterium]|nr:glycosyltransferase [Chitinophagales bacterium]